MLSYNLFPTLPTACFSRALTENLDASIEALKISLNIVNTSWNTKTFFIFCYFYVLSYPKKPVYQFVTNGTDVFPHLNIHFNIRTQIVLLVIKDIIINMLECQIMHSFASLTSLKFKHLFENYYYIFFYLFFFFYSAALEVELSDDSFPPEDFGIVSGMLNVKWDRIAPYPFTKMSF